MKDDVIHIVMEYMPDGDLGHYIEVPWSERDVKIVAEQVLHALKFMHDHKVVHRDIKPLVSLVQCRISIYPSYIYSPIPSHDH